MQRGAERRTRQTIQARLADLVPPLRLDPGRRGLIAMAVVAGLVVLLVGGRVLTARPHAIPVAATGTSLPAGSPAAGGTLQSPLAAPPAGPSGAASPSAGAIVVVDVAGKVRHPGVYRLAPGARVSDAVLAAGGMMAGVDPATVNLARKVIDGEQILVGLTMPAADPPSSGTERASGGAATGPVDLNTATADQLDALPGVGPVLAQRIVDWRIQHGRFDSVDQLNDVSGIGDAKYADLRPLVTVS